MAFSDKDSEAVYRAKEKIAKMKENPHRTLFSTFHGDSENGCVGVEVDVLGRMTSVRIRPRSYYEGGEAQLEADIADANSAAREAADLLDFDLANLVPQLEQASMVTQRIEEEQSQRTERAHRDQRYRDRDEDDYFDDPLQWRM